MMNISIKQTLITSLSALSLLAVSSLVLADIYQWRDSNGGIQFGNIPPKNNSSVVVISKHPKSGRRIAKITSNKHGAKKLANSNIFRNSRRNSLLYKDAVHNEKSRIISVRLLKESKDKLIFDVNYYLSKKIDGSANIGISPNMDNWSSVYTKAHPGRHATTISVKLSDGYKSVIRSSSLKLSIALAKDSGYVGSIFEHDLSFNKVWYKN